MAVQAKLNPPFRAEHIGSLLRPAELVAAFKERTRGNLSAAAYHQLEDRLILDAIRMQEEVGLQSISDGEYRRSSWAYGFVEALDGFVNRPSPWPFHDEAGREYPIETCYAAGRLRRRHGIATPEFEFVRAHTSHTPKITIPSPSFMHFFQGGRAADPAVYPDPEKFWDDLLRIYEEEVAALGKLGATWLQIDEVPQAMLCDPKIREQARAFGEDPDRLTQKYIDAVNRILRARPAGMTVGMHMCRGNFRSRWLAAGGYDAVAERLFNEVEVDGFFLEYDSARAGGFEPLRFMPRHKFAVLGIISTKTPVLEDRDALRRRVDEAARFMPFERLAISPQCGFASTAGGNQITPEDQRAKLRLVVETAAAIWG